MSYKICIFLCVALLGAGTVQAQQPAVEPRIAGLERNAEYMSLLREDAQLQIREDSIVNAAEALRRQLREDPTRRQEVSQEILQLENRIFELRNAKGQLVGRINTIEQEWVLANLNGEAQAIPEPSEEVAVPDSLQVRNLVGNLYFREHLPDADYAALRQAQRMELRAVDYVNRYFANHGAIAELAEAYALATGEQEALDIYSRYTALQGMNRVLADSLSVTWNGIFDNKTYAYNYLLDQLGREQLLTREEERLAEAMRQLATLRDQTASDEVADYFLRKKVVVGYEQAVAGELRLNAALDSLQGVSAQLSAIDFQLPRINVVERYFIDYDSLAFSATPRYSYQHPIPECRVYAHGTVYRILLGTFNTKRAAATFRGAYPLCYQINDAGKWLYYAGAFATEAEALEAQSLLRKRGFVRPEIVVWTDGAARNLSQEPAEQTAAYRVEISGVETLSEQMKTAIVQTAEGVEFSRVGPTLFVVGMFGDKAVADRVANAVQQTDPALEIKVVEIAE